MAASRFAHSAPAPTVTAAAKPRASKLHAAVKPDIVVEDTTLVGDDDVQSAWTKLNAQVHAFAATVGAPSWKRVALSWLLSLVAYGAVFYGAMQLVDMLCFAAVAYTGLGFISFMVAFIGILVAMIAATTAAGFVFRVVMAFDYANVKVRVSGWFGGVTGLVTSHKPTPA